MSLLRRSAAPEPEPAVEEPVNWAERRRQPLYCVGCKLLKPPYVYAENDKDYCVDCARGNLTLMQLHPAGKRDEDIKLEDLLADGPAQDQAS